MNADLGYIPPFAFRLMLAEPIIGIALLQHTAAMSIDVHAVIVRQISPGLKTFPACEVPVFPLHPHKAKSNSRG